MGAGTLGPGAGCQEGHPTCGPARLPDAPRPPTPPAPPVPHKLPTQASVVGKAPVSSWSPGSVRSGVRGCGGLLTASSEPSLFRGTSGRKVRVVQRPNGPVDQRSAQRGSPLLRLPMGKPQGTRLLCLFLPGLHAHPVSHRTPPPPAPTPSPPHDPTSLFPGRPPPPLPTLPPSCVLPTPRPRAAPKLCPPTPGTQAKSLLSLKLGGPRGSHTLSKRGAGGSVGARTPVL